MVKKINITNMKSDKEIIESLSDLGVFSQIKVIIEILLDIRKLLRK